MYMQSMKSFFYSDCSLSVWHIESLKLRLGDKTVSKWDWDQIYVDNDELSHNRNKCDISLSNTYQIFKFFGKLVANLFEFIPSYSIISVRAVYAPLMVSFRGGPTCLFFFNHVFLHESHHKNRYMFYNETGIWKTKKNNNN